MSYKVGAADMAWIYMAGVVAYMRKVSGQMKLISDGFVVW